MVRPSSNPGKTVITFNVKEDTLKQMVNIEDAIAATFDYLDYFGYAQHKFVVEALDKTTIVPFDKVVGNGCNPKK